MMPEFGMCFEALLDLTQAVFLRCLGVEQNDQMIPCIESFHIQIALVLSHKTPEFCIGNEVQHLVEYCVKMKHTKKPTDCYDIQVLDRLSIAQLVVFFYFLGFYVGQ